MSRGHDRERAVKALLEADRVSAPTEKQAAKLRILGSGAIVLAPGRADWKPLLRRGWVEAISEDDGKRFLPPLRITPAGLRALADALERDGHPEMRPMPRQVNEPPHVTELKQKAAEARDEAREARHEAQMMRHKLDMARRALERVA